MAYSVDSLQQDCYPGTTVLINKLDLHSQEALDQAERIYVTLRATELETAAYTGPFNFAFYRSLHRNLFQDLYHWAGELRTVELSKKGTIFYPAKELLQLGEAKFQYLAAANEFQGVSKAVLVEQVADFYHEINMLHPFREGNGRTQRLFFTLLIRRCGWQIDFADCDPDVLMTATIYAAQGIKTFLTEFFRCAISSRA